MKTGSRPRSGFTAVVRSAAICAQLLLVCGLLLGAEGLPADLIIVLGRSAGGAGLPAEMARPMSMLTADQQQGAESNTKREPAQEPEAEDPRKTGPTRPEPDNRKGKKPLQPFRPSEKIKADQAVDFPSDM